MQLEEGRGNEETGMGCLGGPSKRTRQSIRKKVVEALVLTLTDIIQSTTKERKEVTNIIKELL